MNTTTEPTPVTNTTEHTCSANPKFWNCWACHDTKTDHSKCATQLRMLRLENWKQCMSCESRNFKEGSLLCVDCHNAIETLNITVNLNPCASGCGRYGSRHPVCRFCRDLGLDEEVEEESVHMEEDPVGDPEPEFENPYAIQREGCLGCGAPGYTNDYCSRGCAAGEPGLY